MKIGLDDAPASPVGTYSQHLARILKNHAPEHEYVAGNNRYGRIDVYHGFRPGLPLGVRMRQVPAVVTLQNLNFLRYPHLVPQPGRVFRLAAYRRALRNAGRLITLNAAAREELAGRLGMDPRRIEVILPLGALAPQEPPRQEEVEHVRRKYGLPERFVLMLGTVEPRRNHEAVIDALLAAELDAGMVVCGRRTAYADFLLGYARELHIATRVNFIYELSPDDLPALFRLARVFAYLPDAEAEASIVPVVEALRVQLPMVLSDTSSNREAAGDAAVYVHPESVDDVAAALADALDDESFRRDMMSRESRRAELFSELTVAKRLIDIYTSL